MDLPAFLQTTFSFRKEVRWRLGLRLALRTCFAQTAPGILSQITQGSESGHPSTTLSWTNETLPEGASSTFPVLNYILERITLMSSHNKNCHCTPTWNRFKVSNDANGYCLGSGPRCPRYEWVVSLQIGNVGLRYKWFRDSTHTSVYMRYKKLSLSIVRTALFSNTNREFYEAPYQLKVSVWLNIVVSIASLNYRTPRELATVIKQWLTANNDRVFFLLKIILLMRVLYCDVMVKCLPTTSLRGSRFPSLS